MAKTDIKKPLKTAKKPSIPKKRIKKAEKAKPEIAVVQEKISSEAALAQKAHKVKQTYLFSIGRRKSSISRVRYFPSEPFGMIINGKQFDQYFPYFTYQQTVIQPLKVTNNDRIGLYHVRVTGGGLRGQAESTRLAISRALLKQDSSLKPLLKAHGLLVRDSRVKERKKYGLKSARRAPQWQKR
jgi:small subunit ribosomal protein S9